MHLQIFHKVDPLFSLQSGVLWFTLAQIEEERKCSRAAQMELNGKAIKAKKQSTQKENSQRKKEIKAKCTVLTIFGARFRGLKSG